MAVEARPPIALDWPVRDNQIPTAIFVEPVLYDEEMARIFRGPVWHIVAHESEVPRPGDFITTSVGDVPVIVARRKDGCLQGMVNRCAHRSNLVEAHPSGCANAFSCIYHGWTYDLDGSLLSYALPEDFPADFRKEDHGLTPLRLSSRAGVVFATFSSGAPSLEEYLGENMLAALDECFPEEMRFLGSQNWHIEANWKLYAENNYDGYHVRTLHRGVSLLGTGRPEGGGVLDPGQGAAAHAMIYGRGRTPTPSDRAGLSDTSAFDVITRKRAGDGTFSSWFVYVFPSSLFICSWDLIGIRRIIPLAVDKTEVQFRYYAPISEPEAHTRHRSRQASALYGPNGMISLEDNTAFERSQRAAKVRGLNTVLKGTIRHDPPYAYSDEAPIRTFYEQYRALMGL